MSIRIRDDDVLLYGSRQKNPFARFKQVHDIIVNGGGLHVPTILTTNIQDFPEAIDFIEEEFKAGRMEPQWHGAEHVDYAKKSREEIHWDIMDGQEFFVKCFGVNFTKFYTPWGANAEHIKEECEFAGIELIDCTDLIRCVHVNREPEKFRGKDIEIMIHWYEGNKRLKNAFRNLNR